MGGQYHNTNARQTLSRAGPRIGKCIFLEIYMKPPCLSLFCTAHVIVLQTVANNITFTFYQDRPWTVNRGHLWYVWLYVTSGFPCSFHEFQITEIKLFPKSKSHNKCVREDPKRVRYQDIDSKIICKPAKRELIWSLLHFGAFFAMPSSFSGREENRGLRSSHLGLFYFAF